MIMRILVIISLLLPGGLAAVASERAPEQKYPDIVDVSVEHQSGNRYRFAVTLSSPYDSPQRYADAYRIKTLEGEVLGERILHHHHANEQPFTRRLNGVEVPQGIDRVVVEGRDQRYGYGGKTRELSIPAR